uniref:F-box domain-containing protein n=1 Tax=Oryza sativa subsp. japonica TaxID=39947 RepID=Q6EP14_ORYSJ|nr:hypothetical protein [Oryza sativa Japonica Group]BAD29606.1 hypothetical protein [Oryza sativa Japonica Group]
MLINIGDLMINGEKQLYFNIYTHKHLSLRQQDNFAYLVLLDVDVFPSASSRRRGTGSDAAEVIDGVVGEGSSAAVVVDGVAAEGVVAAAVDDEEVGDGSGAAVVVDRFAREGSGAAVVVDGVAGEGSGAAVVGGGSGRVAPRWGAVIVSHVIETSMSSSWLLTSPFTIVTVECKNLVPASVASPEAQEPADAWAGDLHDGVLERVLARLPPDTFFRLHAICCRWSAAAASPHLRPHPVSDSDCIAAVAAGPGAASPRLMLPALLVKRTWCWP